MIKSDVFGKIAQLTFGNKSDLNYGLVLIKIYRFERNAQRKNGGMNDIRNRGMLDLYLVPHPVSIRQLKTE